MPTYALPQQSTQHSAHQSTYCSTIDNISNWSTDNGAFSATSHTPHFHTKWAAYGPTFMSAVNPADNPADKSANQSNGAAYKATEQTANKTTYKSTLEAA